MLSDAKINKTVKLPTTSFCILCKANFVFVKRLRENDVIHLRTINISSFLNPDFFITSSPTLAHHKLMSCFRPLLQTALSGGNTTPCRKNILSGWNESFCSDVSSWLTAWFVRKTRHKQVNRKFLKNVTASSSLWVSPANSSRVVKASSPTTSKACGSHTDMLINFHLNGCPREGKCCKRLISFAPRLSYRKYRKIDVFTVMAQA